MPGAPLGPKQAYRQTGGDVVFCLADDEKNKKVGRRAAKAGGAGEDAEDAYMQALERLVKRISHPDAHFAGILKREVAGRLKIRRRISKEPSAPGTPEEGFRVPEELLSEFRNAGSELVAHFRAQRDQWLVKAGDFAGEHLKAEELEPALEDAMKRFLRFCGNPLAYTWVTSRNLGRDIARKRTRRREVEDVFAQQREISIAQRRVKGSRGKKSSAAAEPQTPGVELDSSATATEEVIYEPPRLSLEGLRHAERRLQTLHQAARLDKKRAVQGNLLWAFVVRHRAEFHELPKSLPGHIEEAWRSEDVDFQGELAGELFNQALEYAHPHLPDLRNDLHTVLLYLFLYEPFFAPFDREQLHGGKLKYELALPRTNQSLDGIRKHVLDAGGKPGEGLNSWNTVGTARVAIHRFEKKLLKRSKKLGLISPAEEKANSHV